MPDAEADTIRARNGSLLSLGASRAEGGSLLSVAGDENRSHETSSVEIDRRSAAQPRPEPAETAPAIEQPPDGTPSFAERLKARIASLRASRAPDEVVQPAPPPPAAPPVVISARRYSDNPYWRPLIDPVKVVSGIVESRRIILATTILGGALGVAIALATPKLYESTTEILVDPRNLNIVEREITQEGLPSDATLAIVENQVRVMTSGTVLDKVVDRLDLDEDPEFNGEGGRDFSIRGMISGLRALLSGGDDSDMAVVRQALAVGNLYDALTVERGSKTFVISISARTWDADKSALIANTLTDVFLETYGELQSGTAGRATDELTSRLDDLRAAVEAAERKVEAFKAEHEIIDPQGRLITDDEIIKLNEQLSVARARTLELNARAQSARGVNVDQVLGGTLPEQAASGLMTELRSQYATLKQEADRLAVRLGPRHPERMAIEAQLAGAREQIQNELRRINASIQVDLKRAVQLEQDLAARLAQLKVRQGDLSSDLVTLRELERDSTSKRAVYEAFLLRARETGQQQSLNTANVSVISEAHPALLPVGPSRSMIAIAGALLGFAAGAGIGAARGAYRSFRDSSGMRRDPASTAFEGRTTQPPEGASPEEGASTRLDESEKDMMQLAYSDEWERRHAAQNGWQRAPEASPQMTAQAPSAPYPHHPQAFQPPHGAMPPQGWPQPHHQAYQPQMPPQGWFYPHPNMPPMPPQAWQQPAYPPSSAAYAPAHADPYGYGAHPQQQMAQPQPQHAPVPHLSLVETARPSAEEETRSAIDEIRESLREFREAMRELSEHRKARRYF